MSEGGEMERKEVPPFEPGKVFMGGFNPNPPRPDPEYVPPPFGAPPFQPCLCAGTALRRKRRHQ